MFDTNKKTSAIKGGQQKKDINLLPDDLITTRKKTSLLSRSQKASARASSSVKELHYPSVEQSGSLPVASSPNFIQRLAGFLRLKKDKPLSAASNISPAAKISKTTTLKHHKTGSAASSSDLNLKRQPAASSLSSGSKKEDQAKAVAPAAEKTNLNGGQQPASSGNTADDGQSSAAAAQDLVKLVAKQARASSSKSAPAQPSAASPKPAFHQVEAEAGNPDSGSEELDVNLLPHQKRHFTPNQIILSYLMVGIIALLAMIMPYVNYYTKNSTLNLQLQSLHKQVAISQDKNKEVSRRAAQLKPFWLKLQAIKALLPAHIYWSHLFTLLEKDTVANAYLTSLDVSGNYKIGLKGEALKLRDVAEQLIVFQRDPQIAHVELTSLNKLQKETDNDAGFEFVFELRLNQSLLRLNNSSK